MHKTKPSILTALLEHLLYFLTCGNSNQISDSKAYIDHVSIALPTVHLALCLALSVRQHCRVAQTAPLPLTFSNSRSQTLRCKNSWN